MDLRKLEPKSGKTQFSVQIPVQEPLTEAFSTFPEQDPMDKVNHMD